MGKIGSGDHDAALFGIWSEPWHSAGAAFPGMIAEGIERGA
jgi:hypothetical protein